MQGEEPVPSARLGGDRPATRRPRRWWRVVTVGVSVLAALGVLSGAAFTPRVANHVGYALPGDRGLPYRIHYNGRDYRSDVTCAGARWCDDDRTPDQRARPYCTSRARLDLAKGNSGTELAKVDDVFTLFGPSHAIFTAGVLPPGETVTAVLVEASTDCYVTYALMGGP